MRCSKATILTWDFQQLFLNLFLLWNIFILHLLWLIVSLGALICAAIHDPSVQVLLSFSISIEKSVVLVGLPSCDSWSLFSFFLLAFNTFFSCFVLLEFLFLCIMGNFLLSPVCVFCMLLYASYTFIDISYFKLGNFLLIFCWKKNVSRSYIPIIHRFDLFIVPEFFFLIDVPVF